MEFNEFNELFKKHVSTLLIGKEYIYFTEVDKDELWDTYLNSFPTGTNEIYRTRREFDCSCCKQFIRQFGNVVAITNNKIKSIWDFTIDDDKFQPVINALSKMVKSSPIKDVFLSSEKTIGTKVSREKAEDGQVTTWEHFSVDLPVKFVNKTSKSIESIIADKRDTKNVFKRSLEELKQSAVDTVLELIGQNSIYKGEEWEGVLTEFLRWQKKYEKLKDEEKDNWCWENGVKVSPVIAKIKNHSIGVLLTNISNEMELDLAVKKYEIIVAPTNYKRPKAIFTKKMIENAQKEIETLGLSSSLGRRFGKLEDISINNILFANKDSAKKISGNPFEELKQEVVVNKKSLDKVEEVSIDTFIKNILPTTTNMSVLLEAKHSANLMSLIAPLDADSKTMLKWDNNFSWAYKGNIADSMKDRVKKAGGKVDGVLRFSIQWNDAGDNEDDLDAHCYEPNGNHIHFPVKGVKHASSGMLDVDIVNPKRQCSDGVAVENITWTDKRKMEEGKYQFIVHNYSSNGAKSGFTAEIEYEGDIYSYEYAIPLRQDEKILVAELTFNKKDGIKFIKSLASTKSTKEIWNVHTNQFQEVSVCMLSPNYWNEQEGIGNKHYFFMLNGCENDTQPNGFFNEFLNNDLMKHKKVFEALGAKMKVEKCDNQLSGIGFSSTQRNSVICKVTGSFTRTIKIMF